MKRILIIEDDPIVARVYGTKYSASGFETSIASDGEMGVRLVDAFKPDIVHLDLLIPKLNGVEVIKRLRRRADLKSLPIVVLSNTYQNHLVKAAMDAGATECVSKATCTPKMMVGIMEKLRDRAPSRAEDTGKSAGFPAQFGREFLTRAPEMIAEFRASVDPLLRAATDAQRRTALTDLSRAAHWLAGQAGIAGFRTVAETASALVTLLQDLMENPAHLNASVQQTIVDVADSLNALLERPDDSKPPAMPPVVLVVDDDVVSRRALVLALGRIHVPTIAVADPWSALRLLEENPFGLVLLDVGMPGMNGFELCRKLRTLHENAATPVVFVTAHARLEDRAAAMEAGGNDLIAKPFLAMELAVKALSLIGARPKRVESAPEPAVSLPAAA